MGVSVGELPHALMFAPLTDTRSSPIPQPDQRPTPDFRKLIHPLRSGRIMPSSPPLWRSIDDDDGGGTGRRGGDVLSRGFCGGMMAGNPSPDRPTRSPASARLLRPTAGKAARDWVLRSGASGRLVVASTYKSVRGHAPRRLRPRRPGALMTRPARPAASARPLAPPAVEA